MNDFLINMNHLTSDFAVWLQILYLYKAAHDVLSEKGSALKDSEYILNLSFWLLSKLKFIVQLKNSLYIILNHLFYDLLCFYIWYFDSDMYIFYLIEHFLEIPTLIIMFFRFSSYTYGLLIHPILVIKTCLLSIFVVTWK